MDQRAGSVEAVLEHATAAASLLDHIAKCHLTSVCLQNSRLQDIDHCDKKQNVTVRCEILPKKRMGQCHILDLSVHLLDGQSA